MYNKTVSQQTSVASSFQRSVGRGYVPFSSPSSIHTFAIDGFTSQWTACDFPLSTSYHEFVPSLRSSFSTV